MTMFGMEFYNVWWVISVEWCLRAEIMGCWWGWRELTSVDRWLLFNWASRDCRQTAWPSDLLPYWNLTHKVAPVHYTKSTISLNPSRAYHVTLITHKHELLTIRSQSHTNISQVTHFFPKSPRFIVACRLLIWGPRQGHSKGNGIWKLPFLW